VVAALDHSRRGYEVAVRAGGHSVAGASLNDGGVVIDVRPMKRIAVDPRARTATVGAGVTWGELDRATQEHGLATTGGRVSTTGVAGLTLGGGSGWLERSYGLACDNLVSVDLVTADGHLVTAGETEHPDLFWALHGGGGNFGVATSFTFRLHPVGPELLAGLLIWPGEAGREVARRYRAVAESAPDGLGSALAFLVGPPEEFMPRHLQGVSCVAVALLHNGPSDEGADLVQPLRDLRPEVDLVQPMPYADFQCMLDDPPGRYNYWTADYLDAFPDEAVDVFVRYGRDLRSPTSQMFAVPWGGAVARVPEPATPLARRQSAWVTHPFALWEGPEGTDENIAWARGFRQEIAPWANGGVYLNFIGDEGQDRVRAAFGDEKYARLAAIKAEYDPRNVFHGNQNIEPAQLQQTRSAARR
jgi:FAD/FMN-containing dehydrogenase